MNWNVWCEHIRRTLKVCGVLPYIDGIIECPDKNTHPDDFEIWEFNNSYAQCLLTNNIADNQMINVTRLQTAHEMWTSLEAVHESTAPLVKYCTKYGKTALPKAHSKW